MARAKSKQLKDYLRVSQYKEKQVNDQKSEQYYEAKSIQNEFGLYHDCLNVVGETVNLMTPNEIMYYLGITFQGVLISAIPASIERALVLENKLQYQLNMAYNGEGSQ